MKKTVLLTLVLLAMSICVVYGLSTYQRTITSTGTVKVVNVGAYWDENCTEAVSAIDWGMIEPGTSERVTIYLKNEGNSPIALSLDATNWNPAEAENYLILSWNYTGESLQPSQVCPTALTLSVAQNIAGITSFSFDVAIVGKG